ncbi:hypothetical protein G7046_g2323 [Stylonectria norvegica]|nr:hypothetical protein G7046_g2323 [Stylonectria norvegica]
MASDSEPPSRARPRRDDDDERLDKADSDGRRRVSDRGSNRPERRRSRERRGSRERRERRRSRTPEASRPRSRSRDSHRVRNRDRSVDREDRGRRSRHGKDSHRKRHRDEDETDSGKRGTERREEDTRVARRSPLRRAGPLPSQENSFAVTTGEEPEKPKEKPNLGNSGALLAAANSITQADGSTIQLKYHEPPEARKPSPRDQWKMFTFKGGDIVDTIDLSLRSCWLIGREMSIVDLSAEHPSISKQHAAIQFRYTERRNEFGDRLGKVKPYLIDLKSANGTTLNDDTIPESSYLELKDKDMIKFGHSTREYIIMLAPRE